MINPATFIGRPLNFRYRCKIYPPTVEQVITNPRFGQFQKILTISQEDIIDELSQKNSKNPNEIQQYPTPFEFLLINCYHHPQFREIAIEAFQFFIHEEVNFFYEQKKIIIGTLTEEVQKISNVDELRTIGEEEYFDFQNCLREVCGDSPLEAPYVPDPDEDPRVTAIKMKARQRDRIKRKQKSKGGISMSTSLIAICCMGIGITPLNIGEMSYASISPLMRMMQEKEKYDIDIRSLLAGADSKKIKPKYWIRNNNE